MRVPFGVWRAFCCVSALLSLLLPTLSARAQDAAKVKGTRPVAVDGIVASARDEDLLGLTRVKFHGLIASELSSIGYHVLGSSIEPGPREISAEPLWLVGIVKEQICDDQAPRQCRIALQWELRNRKGVVEYRTLTRAVDQSLSPDKQRRNLVLMALRSLVQRPRFALQLTDAAEAPKPITQSLGFKRCTRPELPLPEGLRAVASSYTLVESGSHLSGGVILSPDGFILTSAAGVDANAPLYVLLAGRQKLPAQLLSIERGADVALLRVGAHFDTTCLPTRADSLRAGMPVFGVTSPLSEERATSLAGSVVSQSREHEGRATWQTDARIAQAAGAPLLDELGRLAGIVSGRLLSEDRAKSGRFVEIHGALAALRIEPADITDPRLGERTELEIKTDVSYVHDEDDPPFVLTKRYTYGTSPTAHTLRSASVWTGALGAVGVAGTWVAFRTSHGLSPQAHDRLVILNDVSWGLLGLGVVGFGVSYVLPEAHDTVGVVLQTARRAPLRVSFGPGSAQLSGSF